MERMAPFWSHAHSAAVGIQCPSLKAYSADDHFSHGQLVLGALVLQSPGCEFAPDALHHFEETCDMFYTAKDHSFQPENAYVRSIILLFWRKLAESRFVLQDESLQAKSQSITLFYKLPWGFR